MATSCNATTLPTGLLATAAGPSGHYRRARKYSYTQHIHNTTRVQHIDTALILFCLHAVAYSVP